MRRFRSVGRSRRGPTVELRLYSRTEGTWTVLEVGGEVDLSTAASLRTRIDEIVASGARRLVVDLTAVGFIDSSGLSALVSAMKAMRVAEGELMLVCGAESIFKVFTVTGLDRMFAIRRSVAEAINS
jgi:anti-sigma B factor antagonist